MMWRCAYGIILFLVLGLFQAQGQWEQVRYRGNTYVTLDSFCDFYSFKHAGTEGAKTTLFTGPYGTLKLTDEGRECYISGRKVWLALNMTTNESGKRLISYVDVVKMMEPILRSQKVKKLRPIKGVVIDPGHGGSDLGARGRFGLLEKDMNLDTSQRLERILKSAGIPTVMTRRTDVFVPLEQRAAIAAQYPNYLFVSVHYNQGQSQAAGIETFALTPQYAPSTDSAGVMRISDATRENGNRNDEANILLADFIHQEVRRLHPVEGDRGVKRARFVVLRLNSLPATLVEGGFLSNPGDAKLIGSPSYRDKLAAGIAKGVRRFIALSKGNAGSDVREDAPAELTRPPVPAVPEPPRPLPAITAKPEPSKPVDPNKPTTPGKTPPSADPSTTKPAKPPTVPTTGKVKPADTTALTPPAKTPEPSATKVAPAPAPSVKPKPAAKPKPVEKPVTKTPTTPEVKSSEPDPNVPQMNATETPVVDNIKPVKTPLIETAPVPEKKSSGPMIETAPVIRSTPAPDPAPEQNPSRDPASSSTPETH